MPDHTKDGWTVGNERDALGARCEAWQDAIEAALGPGWPGDCGACADDARGPQHPVR